MRARWSLLISLVLAIPLVAQEPRPATVEPGWFETREGVRLDYAWRYAPGDEPGREAPGFDDSSWEPVRPALAPGELPRGGWPGVGWFRRHLVIAPAVRGRTVALRIESPGAATVYLDGTPVLSTGGARPELPSPRSDATLITLSGGTQLLAVRYAHPTQTGPSGEIGFRLQLAEPSLSPAPPARWAIALRGAMVALPVFLALLHLALYAFDRRGRENLFYACEMAAFGLIIVHDFREAVLPARQQITERLNDGAPLLAIFFALLTYYAIRTARLPRTWRLFALVGGTCFVASYVAPDSIDQYLWIGYFVAMLVEVVRVERREPTVEREGARFILAAFTIVALSIALQIPINFGLIEPPGGLREVYLVGILASAIGMSLFLAHTMGRRRISELENERKSEELGRARDLQLSMLPRELPAIEGLDVAAATRTAAEVGGDYYDVRTAGEGALLLAFGDATGHGLASGIVVTAAKALFQSLHAGEPVAEQLARCDRAMRAMQLPSLRMCMSLARIAPGKIAVASAAMPPVLLHRRATGLVEELGAGGLPLGSRLAAGYEEVRASLASGDTLLFASDGLAEQTGDDGAQFGYDNVAAALADAAVRPSAAEVLDRLLSAAMLHRGTRPQDDDMTFVVVRVR